MKRLHTFTVMAVALIISACATASGNRNPEPLMIQEQGSFAAGGTVVTAPGTFDPIKQGAYNPAGPDSAGQTLHGDHAYVFYQVPVNAIVTAGIGRVQQWGAPIDEIRQGDVVWIPPDQKHWHGASPDSSMAHIAIVEQLDGKSTDWMEKVSEEQYNMPVRGQESSTVPNASAQGAQPTQAQRLIGDFSPKLVDLTDRVLFGEVWARPQLSQRDCSLVTVSALIAMNRPDQLRSHLARARNNGVTQEEVVETITHLAFYSGWPNAITAISVAREVFTEGEQEDPQ